MNHDHCIWCPEKLNSFVLLIMKCSLSDYGFIYMSDDHCGW